MNIVFLMGTIISKVDFKFTLNGIHDSIVLFELKLLNGSIVKITAFNEIADYCYRNLEKENIVMLQGKLSNRYGVELSRVYNFKKQEKKGGKMK